MSESLKTGIFVWSLFDIILKQHLAMFSPKDLLFRANPSVYNEHWGSKCCDGFLFGHRLDSVTLDTANANAIDLSSATEVEQCECPQGYTGISCEVTSQTVLCVHILKPSNYYKLSLITLSWKNVLLAKRYISSLTYILYFNFSHGVSSLLYIHHKC